MTKIHIGIKETLKYIPIKKHTKNTKDCLGGGGGVGGVNFGRFLFLGGGSGKPPFSRGKRGGEEKKKN